ncbi:mRNA m6A methyltransferase non-catalytic subunit, partial [Phenoliferia sp. Uapishka_3]
MQVPASSFRPPHRTAPRQGQPPSNRNFGQSSAGGGRPAATFPPPPRFNSNGKSPELQPGVLSPEQLNKVARWGPSYVVSEDSIRNDYSTHYVQSGSRPQNHLRGADVTNRFSECVFDSGAHPYMRSSQQSTPCRYPKLSSLLNLKHSQLSSHHHSIPPTHLETSVSPSTLTDLLSPNRFDVILITPPKDVGFEELKAFDMGRVAATPGFVWLWVGSGQKGDGVGLEKGRELISAWGYRRCEDIVWLKTNKRAPANDLITESSGVFTPTVEHCLMGIRGTVRRSNDPWFVHCNVDTDVLVWEGDTDDKDLKPPELQSLIENFCLGTRRLHLFGSPHSLRRGWVTVGPSFQPLVASSSSSDTPIIRQVEGEETSWKAVPYIKESFDKCFARAGQQHTLIGALEDQMRDADISGSSPPPSLQKVSTLLPYLEELDALRPKSPPPRNGQPSSGGLGRGRGAGLGVTRSAILPNNNMSSRGARGPPPNRGPIPPLYPPQFFPPPPQGFPQMGYQHQVFYPPSMGYGGNPYAATPIPASQGYANQQYNQYAGYNNQASNFAYPPPAPPNQIQFLQQQQQQFYQNQRWLAMGGGQQTMGTPYGSPGAGADQMGGQMQMQMQGGWQGQGQGQVQGDGYRGGYGQQHYSPNPP